MTKEKFLYGLNACAVTYHNDQKLYEHDDLIKCFEDLGIFEQDPKTVKVLKMRDATPEERESIYKYIKSISKPTVTADNFWDLEQEPCDDMVSRGVFEQVMWERDVAIDQLKELGYSLGEKPRTGRWMRTNYSYTFECSECGQGVMASAA